MAADCRAKLFSAYVRRTVQPRVSRVSYLFLADTCPRHLQFCLFPVIRRGHLQGPRPVSDIISHSPNKHKGLCLCFLPLMRRAKVLGWMGALGNQSRHANLSCLAPERLAWLGNPGALSEKWLFSFPFDQAVHGIFGRTRNDLSSTCVSIYSFKAES